MIKLMTYDNNGYTNKIEQTGYKILGLHHIVRTWDWSHSKANSCYYCVKMIDDSIICVLKEDFEEAVGLINEE